MYAEHERLIGEATSSFREQLARAEEDKHKIQAQSMALLLRAERAEAEVERLRAALHGAMSMVRGGYQPVAIVEQIERALAAQ